jgi:dihydropteroate synthase
VLSLADLSHLATHFATELAIAPPDLRVGDRTFALGAGPILMGVVNLSKDSTYRDSIAQTTESALRKSRVLATEGAAIIDIGAESTTAKASRVSAQAQIDSLVPVIGPLVAEGLLVSTETYEPSVVEAALSVGTQVLNMTGTEHEEAMLDLAASHDSTVVMCFSGGGNVREIVDLNVNSDPIPDLLAHFEPRVEKARARGVERLVIDPGMGFYYGNLTDPSLRARHQGSVLLNSFRLRTLGLPICNAMPSAYALFEEHYRTAEPFFSVLAMLGGTDVIRTHEVPKVRAILETMALLEA